MKKVVLSLAILFIFSLLSGCDTKTTKSIINSELVKRNNGLIGDKITGFSINPKDSNQWLLRCYDRSYITRNKGLSWEIINPANEDIVNYPEFNRQGELVMYDDYALYTKTAESNSWTKHIIPDSLKVNFIKTSPSGLVYWFFQKEDPEQNYLATQLDLSGLMAINNNTLDSLKNRQAKYQYDLFHDTSFVLINGGHLLFNNPENGKIQKRMNGIENAYIEMLIPDQNNNDRIYAIQNGLYKMDMDTQFFLYESNNFGESWSLIDSAKRTEDILKKPEIKSNYQALKKRISKNPNDKLFNNYQIQVNDSTILSTLNNELILYNIINNDQNVILKDYELVRSIGKFKQENYMYTALPQLSTNQLKILFTNESGGIQLVTFTL
ncbi:hypothetical protein [Marinigracilibium pacificum]|uniref:Uncharacterized protein n=1 Tax=Marinigracilibium pacificum TaxID=2729599 RepID=A0A848J3H2_9BACT|nr:hypothetical protein [Marinigracilibium pacificum]NMM49080.1 hypothetical protein [Marinigracilibium pacificum]